MTNDGEEAVVVVQTPLSPNMQNLVNALKGTQSILDSQLDSVIREIPGATASSQYCSRIGTTEPPCWKTVILSNGVAVQFQKARNSDGYYVWVPIQWASSNWLPSLNAEQKNQQLLAIRQSGRILNKTETYLGTIEAVYFMFPGVYGANQLINGNQRILGALSLAADLASFGIASKVNAVKVGCTSIVLSGAAARVTNAAQNPSIGTGVDAALAIVEGSLVGVQFVRVVVRNGRGFVKAGSSGAGANAIANALGKNLNEIAEGGQGIPCAQLAQLGVKAKKPGWQTFAGDFLDETTPWQTGSFESVVHAEYNGTSIGIFSGNVIYPSSKTVNLGTVEIFGDATSCRYGLNGTQLYRSVLSNPLIGQNAGLWKITSYWAGDNRAKYQCAYDAAIAAGKTVEQAAQAGAKATKEYINMVERLGARITKYPQGRDNLSVEYQIQLPRP